MKALLVFAMAPLLTGCMVDTVAKTAVGIVTLPVKVASAGVDAVTTSQSERDEKAGKAMRKQDQERGRLAREQAERCRSGRALRSDDCSTVTPR